MRIKLWDKCSIWTDFQLTNDIRFHNFTRLNFGSFKFLLLAIFSCCLGSSNFQRNWGVYSLIVYVMIYPEQNYMLTLLALAGVWRYFAVCYWCNDVVRSGALMSSSLKGNTFESHWVCWASEQLVWGGRLSVLRREIVGIEEGDCRYWGGRCWYWRGRLSVLRREIVCIGEGDCRYWGGRLSVLRRETVGIEEGDCGRVFILEG